MDALLMVDLQNDFVPGGTLAVPEGDQVVPVANRLQAHFELVVATKDWHPRDHGSFAANHPGRQVGEEIDLHGLAQILWPVHCVQNTPGAEFVAGLDISGVERVFQKGVDPEIDSYSAFYDNAHRRSTGLGEFLKERGVERLCVMGLATDYCVRFSALDALGLGFETVIVRDGCRAVNLQPEDGERALDEMRRAGARLAFSDEVIADLSSAG